MFMFLGTFASCSDPTITTRAECVGDDLMWRNPWVGSFDSTT